MKFKIVFSFGLGLFLCSCKQNTESMGFSNFLDDYYETYLKYNPLVATAAGDYRYNDQFPNNISETYISSYRKALNTTKVELFKYDRAKLSNDDKTSYDILQWELDIALEDLNQGFEYMPIDQMWSLNLYFGQLASGSGIQPFRNAEDYSIWLQRVDGYIIWLDTAIERMSEGIKKQYVLPQSLIKKVIPQFEAMVIGQLEDHLFYQPINNFPDHVTQEDKTKIAAQFRDMISNKLIPANQRMLDFLQNTYLPNGRTSSGINAIPNGNDIYDHMIKKYTTTSLSAAEIHQLGLQEVAKLRSEMEIVKANLEFEGDLFSFFNHVRESKTLMPFTTPEQVIENFENIHKKMLPQLDKLFDLKPKTNFEIRRTEAFREASSSAEYNQGSVDGTRPGIFYVPIPDATKYNIYADEDLFLHEAIPGHHYQCSLQQENERLPKFRRTIWFNAYGEGWALYSESLGKELGLYQDPYQYFGMLGAEMHRAIRLVVDTGIHAMGWTREDAIQYSLENEAEPEAIIVSEIERYMANPGQALSYKIGQIKIIELRERATASLGDKFNIKAFHNLVLQPGCLPLAILENLVNEWIAEYVNK